VTNLQSIAVSTPPGWSWELNAACRGLGDDLFYARNNERGQTKRRREDAAKKVCATCPVAGPCLAGALSAGEVYGVWGGLTATERVGLPRRNSRRRQAHGTRSLAV
jgi:WhiB family redox-sensing transcriptional regulator